PAAVVVEDRIVVAFAGAHAEGGRQVVELERAEHRRRREHRRGRDLEHPVGSDELVALRRERLRVLLLLDREHRPELTRTGGHLLRLRGRRREKAGEDDRCAPRSHRPHRLRLRPGQLATWAISPILTHVRRAPSHLREWPAAERASRAASEVGTSGACSASSRDGGPRDVDARSLMGELSQRMHRGPRREIFENETRIHVAVHEVDEDDREAFAACLQQRIEALEGVRWARYNGALGRVVVERDPERAGTDAIVAEIERAEEELCAGSTFARPVPAYPGDREPERRRWIEIAADSASLALTTALRLRGTARTPHDIDFAAITATLDSIPRVRKSMERGVSRRAVDLTFELTKALSMFVVRSEAGPVTALFSHILNLRESRARRAAWIEREPELCADREHHPPHVRPRKDRPTPLRQGPIERYEVGAIPVSLGAY